MIHVYTVPSGELIAASPIHPTDDVAAIAEQDAAAFAAALAMLHDGVACLVAYDGDTGERFPPEAWRA